MMRGDRDQNCCQSCLTKAQRTLIGGLESGFNRYGQFVARRPIVVIIGSVILFGALVAGMLRLEEENDGLKIWVPSGTEFKENTEWLRDTFPSYSRPNFIILYTEKGNILTVSALKRIYELRKKIVAIETVNKTTWANRCEMIPISISESGTGGTGGTAAKPFPELCNDLAEKEKAKDLAPKRCDESHIFEVWAKNGDFPVTILDSYTDADVLKDLNVNDLTSGLTGSAMSLSFLGSKEFDNDGKLKSAKAMTLTFNGFYSDPEKEGKEKEEYDLSQEWEEEFIKVVQEFTFDGLDIKHYPNAARSSDDINGDAIGSDLNLLFAGYFLVIVYVMIMLGKFNSVEHRALLSLTGIISVVFGILGSYGFCSLIGFFYTPVHSIMPFMLLGIGIDDMFVIAQSFDTIEEKDKNKPLVERFGICMEHAGVAITITSVTDLMAFGIGASTALPALRSFCVYAAFGILFVFFFMISFFLGWFVLDQRRAESPRDAIICCWKKNNWKPNACSQKSILQSIFHAYAKLLTKMYVKVGILIFTAILIGFSAWRVSLLKSDFDEKWYINEGTYLRSYLDAKDEYFKTSGGISGHIYIVDTPDLYKKMDQVKLLQAEVDDLAKVNVLEVNSTRGSFNQAFEVFVDYVKRLPAYPETPLSSDETFRSYLAEFLYTVGGGFRPSVKFTEPLECKAMTPGVKMISMHYKHLMYEGGAQEHIENINKVEEVVAKYKTSMGSERLFAYSGQYTNYKIMEVITEELVRNILLAIMCVFIATLVLIFNLWTSLLVVMSVLMALVCVGGFMQIWGLAIDTSAAVLISIAMGLTVDYSAHIAHAFMVVTGNRNERVVDTLTDMGPAVLNGGFSTYLAFAMLMTSQSYVFKTFFKIFFLIVVFGLYHGLVFLPVVLSIIGPKSSSVHDGNHSNKVTPMRVTPMGSSTSLTRLQRKSQPMIDVYD